MKRFEVLWYGGKTEKEASDSDCETEEFGTRNSAMKFFNKHKDDEDKWNFMVTHRDADWCIVEDIVYSYVKKEIKQAKAL